MTKVSCTVDTCAYYKNNKCYSTSINIGGKGVAKSELTCCGTFLTKTGYSDLADKTEMRGEVEEVTCQVDTCKYHDKGHCTLEKISIISKGQAEIYTQTECESFTKGSCCFE